MRTLDENPGRAGTRHGAQNIKQAQHIIHHGTACRNCGTPLYPREFRYCRPCRAYLALYRAVCELSRITGPLS